MIRKLGKHIGTIKAGNITYDAMKSASINEMNEKINELVDAVNKLETMAKNTNTVLESLIKENNIHEKQIDELQMKVEPEKVEPTDPYAEQRKWIGKLCKFWDDSDKPELCVYDILCNIFDITHHENCPFQCGNGEWYEYCEPVKPDDDIIYKGE